MAEHFRSQFHEGIAQGRGQLHVPDHLADDGLGGRIAAVRQNADNVGGQILVHGHHHRGGTHGNTREDDFLIGTKMLRSKLGPGQTVPVFVDAKGNDLSPAAAAAPLVHQQHRPAQQEAPLDTAAQIPLGAAPVAVEHDLHGRAGSIFKKVCVEGQAVEGSNGKMLSWHGPDLPGPAFHLRAVRLVNFPLGDVDGIGLHHILPGCVKGHPEAGIGCGYCCKHHEHSGSQKNPKGGHKIIS